MAPRVLPSLALLALLLTAVVGLAAAAAGPEHPAGGPSPPDTWDNFSVWERTYFDDLRSAGNQSLFGVTRTASGYLLVGSGESYVGASDGQIDAQVVETDRQGRRQWGRSYLTFGTHHRVFHDATKTGSRAYRYGGTVNGPSRFQAGEYWLFEADRDVTDWRRQGGDGAFYEILPAPGGHAVVGSGLILAVENDSGGELLWRQSLPGDVAIRDGVSTADGFVLAGYTRLDTSSATTEAVALGIGPEGTVRWRRPLGTNGSSRFRGVATAADGATVLAGETVVGGNRTARVVASDPSGTVTWTDRPLGPGSTLHDVATTATGRTVVVGRDPSVGGVLLRYDAVGRLVSTQQYGAVLRDVIPAGNGSVLAVGARQGDGRDLFAVRVDLVPPRPALSTATETAAVGRDAVRFSAAGATDNIGIAAYRWDFDGDGTVDAVTNRSETTHTFGDIGHVSPRVTVVDRAGRTATATVSPPLEITDTTPPVPVLSHPGNRRAATTAPTLLAANDSRDNHRIAAYRWDLDGDGASDRVTDTPAVRHRFADSRGTAQVELTVVDAAGNRNTTTVPLTLRENDVPTLSVDHATYPVDHPRSERALRLVATVEDTVGTVTVEWQLPNGSVLTGRSVALPVTAPSMTVRAVAVDEYGARATERVTVSVDQPEPRPPAEPRPTLLELVWGLVFGRF